MSAVFLAVVAIEWAGWVIQHRAVLGQEIGIDYRIYTDAAARWMAGASFYPTYQLAGPYELAPPAVLYPPTILPLLVAFTALPPVLWWVIPIFVTVVCVARLRPAAWSWPLMLAGLASGQAGLTLVHGTPTLWVLAAVALATRWGWAGALVLLKPSVAPFALLGVRTPGWWIVVAGMAAASLCVVSLWFDWLTVLSNARGPHASLLYSLVDAPMLAIPIWARLASRGP